MALTTVDAGLLNTQAQYTGFKNRLYNGSMEVWQRGTSQSASGYGSADRWYNNCSGTTTVSRDTSVPTGVALQYSIKWVTGASSSFGQFYQAIEQNNVIPLRGKTVTASMYIKTSSYGSGSLIMRTTYSNSSDSQASSSSGTIINDTVVTGTAVTAWTRISGTFTVPADAVGICIALLPDVAQNSGASVYMTGAQLELGSTATSFDYRPYSTELALCQRYCYVGLSDVLQNGVGATPSIAWFHVDLKQVMRVAPTVTVSGTIQISDDATADYQLATPTIANTALVDSGGRIRIDGWTGLTQFRAYAGVSTIYTGKFVFNSEL